MLTRIRRSLVLKAALLFAVAALVPLLLAAAFVFRSARTALYREIVSGLDVRVVLMRDTLDARLAALRGNLVAWAGLDVMNDLLAEDIDKRVSVVLEGLKRDYSLDGEIYAVGLDGRVIAASAPAAVGRRLPVSLPAGHAGTVVGQGLHPSAFDRHNVIAFAAPIFARAIEHRAIGVLYLEYRVRDLTRSVLEGAVPLAAIVTPDRRVVAASTRWAPELEHAPDGTREYGPFILARASQRQDVAGDGSPWTIVGAAERDVVLAPVTQVERFSLLAGLAGVVLLVALIAAVAARTIRPLTAVAGAADEIAATMDLSHRVPAAGEDEVGRVGRAFNRMVDEVEANVDRLLEANVEMLEVLGSAIAKRDSDTSAHNYRVTLMALRLAESRGLPRPELQALVKGSFLHDVGKIAISDLILLKPGKLDAAEYETMKTHVVHGTDIVARYAWLRDAMDVVGHHHERYDGTGYPARLAGTAIPLHARIFAIADVFDALTSERPYKRALTLEEALAIMRADRGRHFDPALFDLFDALAPDLYEDICRGQASALTATLQERMRACFFG